MDTKYEKLRKKSQDCQKMFKSNKNCLVVSSFQQRENKQETDEG